MGIARRILAENASSKTQTGCRPRVFSWVLRAAMHSSKPKRKYVPALNTSSSQCADVSVSLELFGSSGLQNYLRQVSSILQHENTYWLKKGICGCDYLATRLAKVELLLDARDSRLHPGILDATRRIHDGYSSPVLIMNRKASSLPQ